QGFVADAEIGVRTDFYVVQDDSAFAQNDLRLVPSAGVTLRWPMARQGAEGTTHLLEPTVSLGWAELYGGTPPNEDSTRTELDRANLYAISRYAGDDAVETGAQVAAGLTWTRYGAAGVTSSLSFGRIMRADAATGFTPSSGLDGQQSDWLVAGQLIAPGGFLIDARSLWDETDGLRVADSRINWQNDTLTLRANFLWLGPDAQEDRTGTKSEWTLSAESKLSETWSLDVDARYDLVTDRPVRAGIGLRWRNECVTVDVSASRRFTSSSTVESSTTFGLSGTIGGFSTGRAAGGIATGCGN
ncbi:MAG: LPS-assembly protein LptD, partial [Paracoccaceae bacterium]|nr:LPS-assembly protein LptD [Paracoccaceae bacterium]